MFDFEIEPLELILELVKELKAINNPIAFQKFDKLADHETQIIIANSWKRKLQLTARGLQNWHRPQCYCKGFCPLKVAFSLALQKFSKYLTLLSTSEPKGRRHRKSYYTKPTYTCLTLFN